MTDPATRGAMPLDPARRRAGHSTPGTPRRLPTAVVHGCLEDGLKVCLGLLASDRARFVPAAVAWHARWCAWAPGIDFAESRAALSALEALLGEDPAAAARRLRASCQRQGFEEVTGVLDAWLRDRRGPVVALPVKSPSRPLTAV